MKEKEKAEAARRVRATCNLLAFDMCMWGASIWMAQALLNWPLRCALPLLRSQLPLGNRKRRRAIKIFATMKSYLCVRVCVPCVPRPHLGKRSEGKVESKGKGSSRGAK